MRFFQKGIFFLLCVSVPTMASALIVAPLSSPMTSECHPEMSWAFDVYGTGVYNISDIYDATHESYVSSSSRVLVYTSGNGITLSSNQSDWVQPTTYAPQPGSYYAAWLNPGAHLNVENLTVADRGQMVAQVVYQIRRAPIRQDGTPIPTGYWFSFASNPFPTIIDRGNLNLSFDLSDVTVENECANIYPHWCWDGVVDSSDGESCDPADTSRTGWGVGRCNASCQPITTPVYACASLTASPASSNTGSLTSAMTCAATDGTANHTFRINCGNSANTVINAASGTCSYTSLGDFQASCLVDADTTPAPTCLQGVSVTNTAASCIPGPTTGTQASPITAATAGLCPTGAVVGNFTATVNGDTTNYTWSCNGLSGGSCNANYTSTTTSSGGGSCEPGPTVGPQSSPITATTAGLCPVGAPVSNFAATTTGNTTNYSWWCAGVSGTSCSASYTPTTTSSGGGSCEPGPTVGPQTSSITATTAGLCPAGAPVSNFTATTTGDTTNYTWWCAGVSGDSCRASYTSTSGTSGSSSSGGGTRCGNSIVEPALWEDCDAGEHNGDAGYACNDNCKFGNTNPGDTAQGFRLMNTTPGRGGSFLLMDNYHAIVGDGAPVFRSGQSLYFTATYPIYIPAGSVKKVLTDGQYIRGTNVTDTINTGICVGNGTIDAKIVDTSEAGYHIQNMPCQTELPLFDYPQLSQFVGSTENLWTASYVDTKDREDAFTVNLGYFSEPINVRVTRPMVTNTAGGNAYLARAAGYDVNSIASIFLENVRKGNFTTASITDGLWVNRALSSTTLNSNAGGITSSVSESGSITAFTYQTPGATASPVQVTAGSIDGTIGSKLGDNENVRVISGNLEITNPVQLSGVKTIVVEGDMTIASDMKYSADVNGSFAFIVKRNLIIKNNVKEIAGVFVVRGVIRGEDVTTAERLYIDGNLYGNSTTLVESRTYVRGDVDSSALTTGVTINYSSRAFRNPPPLLTQFLDQYNVQKVAK